MPSKEENEEVIDDGIKKQTDNDISNEVLRNSLLFACKNLAKQGKAASYSEKLNLPKVQAPQYIHKNEKVHGDEENDKLEYLWMPSMKVVDNRFANRIEKYAHMEFTRNYNIYRLYTPKGAIFVFFLFGLALLSCGIALVKSSNNSFSLEVPYTEDNSGPITFTISHDLAAPVYFYYKIKDFYITHKRVTYDSRPLTINTGKCKIFTTFEEILNLRCIDGKNTLNGVDEWCPIKNSEPAFKLPAYPCGAISATIMTDKFIVCPASYMYELSTVKMRKDKTPNCLPLSLRLEEEDYGLFHASKKKSELDRKFLWLDLSNTMFRNWIQLPYDSTFLKPYAVLNQDLPAGNYQLFVTDNYWPAKAWKAEKAFYVAKTGFLGTSATVFEIIVLATAALYLLSGIVFAILWLGKYNCGLSPWRGIEIVDEMKNDARNVPVKHCMPTDPRKYSNVPQARFPCPCPNHLGDHIRRES